MKKHSFIGGGLLLFLVIFVNVTRSYAQTPSLNLTVSPTVLELTGEPGSKLEGKIRVRNNNSAPIAVTLHIDKLKSDLNGKITPVKADASDTYLSWLSFENSRATVKPQEWTDLSYSLTIPKEAAFSYYYAIRVAQDTPVNSSVQTKVLGEVVVPLLLTIKREGAKREAKLIEFKTTNFINEYLPVAFVTTVENLGNIHLKPRGNIFIRGAKEKDLGIIEVNPGLGTVLPGAQRTFISEWTDGFLTKEPVTEDGEPKLDSHGKPVLHVKINWNKLTNFRFGKYTASLLLVYDNGTRDIPLEATTTFWVIPYTAITLLVSSLIVLFFVVRFCLKLYVKKQVKKYHNRI